MSGGYALLGDDGKILPENMPASLGGQAGEAFPVGAVFISVVSTDPATLLGYGTWQAFGAGRVLVGLDSGDTDFDTVEETGGAKTVTLTEAQIPSHTHVQNAHNHGITDPGHQHDEGYRNTGTAGTAGVQGASTANNANITNGIASKTTGITVNNATATNQNTGGGQGHNNMPPYLVCFFWKRVS